MNSELVRRIAFTLGALLVYRIGAYIPLPGTDVATWSHLSGLHTRGIFGLIDMPAGAPARHFAIFALGILPYITAAILMQIAAIGSPRLRALGASGRPRPRQNRGLHALSHDRPDGLSGLWPGAGPRRPAWLGAAARPAVSAHDGVHAHRRHHVAHLARQSDHRARHRQRLGAYSGGRPPGRNAGECRPCVRARPHGLHLGRT